MSRAQTTTTDVAALIRARNCLLWLVSREEVRVERFLLAAAQAAKYDIRFWDCWTGITDSVGKAVDANVRDPSQVVTKIRDSKERHLWVLRDFPAFLGNPMVLRGLRSLARSLPNETPDEARAIVILSPRSEIPPELQGHAITIDWPLPDREEIAQLLDSLVSALPPDIAANAAPNGTREAAIDAAVGLTYEEASSCYAKSLVTTKRIDPKAVAAEKKRVIARERVLEWYDADPRGLDAVGGLDALKAWLVRRRAALSQRARDFGLPAPKGVLIVGIPGTGKSLTAKAVATAWGVPLLRLDLGALKSKWVGESEANIRKALQVAETVAPAILWLDEIEKALGGATGGAADGGVSADALGTILSWLQERAGSVFVVATANDVRALPPELLRKGRFDEIFFTDLPTAPEREAVLVAALKQHRQEAEGVDVKRLARLTVGYTGAEIAALVPEALFSAFADGERKITTEDLATATETVVPLSKTSAEKISTLREWAKGRARSASAQIETAGVNEGRKLDI